VRQKGYLNKKQVGESVAEFHYPPTKCRRSYREVVVRKNLGVQKSERVLFDDIKDFFAVSAKTEEQIASPLDWNETGRAAGVIIHNTCPR
jgi:hypothetical protein